MINSLTKFWSDGSDEYNKVIKYQLSNKKECEHWLKELDYDLGGKKGLRVIDAGCGPGFFSIILSKLGHKVLSADGAEGMVKCAKKNLTDYGFIADVSLTDVVEFPNEAPSSIDAIISRDVVWALYDPQRAYERWYELLKPGGRIVVFDANYGYKKETLPKKLWRYWGSFLILLTEHRARSHNRDVFLDMPNCLVERPKADIERLEALGYKIIRCETDAYRNKGLYKMEYGWQAKPFVIVAEK